MQGLRAHSGFCEDAGAYSCFGCAVHELQYHILYLPISVSGINWYPSVLVFQCWSGEEGGAHVAFAKETCVLCCMGLELTLPGIDVRTF
jgi:hypothetical protein